VRTLRPVAERAGRSPPQSQEAAMKHSTRVFLTLLSVLALVVASPKGEALAQPPGPCCLVPDNGTGTADHPPSCVVGYSGQLQVIDGLPPGTTIDIAATLHLFAGLLQVPGGALGGNKETWTATMPFAMTGTGSLVGFNRNIAMPISTGESHSAPRTLFAPSQTFATDLFMLQGQITLDPDFALLRITAGTNFGMPSPGQTIFTQQSGSWGVDSFFDITYRIDFVGAPGGAVAGMSGSTTGTYRFSMCHDEPTPARRSTWGTVKAIYR
jgi:hypothetical protein